MADKYDLIDKYLAGETSPEESLRVLAAIATDPKLEEYWVTQKRLDYEEERLNEYGSFIPASSMAADDGRNLCDYQCEKLILQKAGLNVNEEELSMTSRRNYWLRSQGTPLYNVGRLLECKGFVVKRVYDATWELLCQSLSDYYVISIVNGDVLEPKNAGEESVNIENDANHAVMVLSVSGNNRVTIYNPAKNEDSVEYSKKLFLDAWQESNFYMALVEKTPSNKYVPQPINLSDITLDDDLMELVELLAENAHDVWGVGKLETAAKDGRILEYDAVDGDRDIVDENGVTRKMRYSHFFRPYSRLSEDDKKPDRDSVVSTVKLIKRLGYRLVNINGMYKCPDCGDIIEPSNNFCPNCGRQLTWEDFR